MNLETLTVQCPYCGESIEAQVEDLPEDQSYVEDCSVCCRPIQFDITPGENGVEAAVSRSE
jgi:transcription elongation factor Elf1